MRLYSNKFIALFVVFGLALSAAEVLAQSANEVASDLQEAPREEVSEEFQNEAKQSRINTSLVYAGELSDTTFDEARPEPTLNEWRWDIDVSNTNVFIVLLLFALAIFLWLKFGGSGAILSAAPKSSPKPKRVSPESWNLNDDWVNTDRRKLLGRLAKMKDYRAGMIELLRYCLLFGSEECNTIFARSDTEREAFRRLPKSWSKRPILRQLLNKTELVHYGGREVTQSDYDAAIELGREILLRPSEINKSEVVDGGVKMGLAR